ncbi:hypothetical protein [Mycobacterium sp.]|uniref:hypothetical protein n=1 Tax=Mycobacterium sp. TaxID=1785 RepID=UPI003CA44211
MPASERQRVAGRAQRWLDQTSPDALSARLFDASPLWVSVASSSIIELTPSGKRLLAKAKLALDDELTAHLGAVLSPRALQQFAATLTKLRAGPIYLDTAIARD